MGKKKKLLMMKYQATVRNIYLIISEHYINLLNTDYNNLIVKIEDSFLMDQ